MSAMQERRFLGSHFKFQAAYNQILEQESKPRYTLDLKYFLTDPEQNSKFYSTQMVESNILVLPKIRADWENSMTY